MPSTGVVVSPDGPLAVVATGPAGAARREVLAGLLDVPPATLLTGGDSYLVARYAPEVNRVAFVPGSRRPYPYNSDKSVGRVALPRPPRRVEVHLPAGLLRHLAVVGAPDTDGLGHAGRRVLAEAVDRAGALLVVIAADQVFTAEELDVLAVLARTRPTVFFVVTPGTIGPGGGAPNPADPAGDTGEPAVRSTERGAPSPDPIESAIRAQRAALLAAVPDLAEAEWFPYRPSGVTALRRALVAWADREGARRLDRAAPPAAHRTVPVAPDAHRRDWAERLQEQARQHARRIGRQLALELAHVHLRAVREIVFGAGCVGLPRLLDREAHALSQLATTACDEAVRQLVLDAGTEVLGAPPDEATYRRICAAVRAALADPRTDRSLARVLLVTIAGDVTELTGPGALAGLDAHPGAPRSAVLPPIAVAVADSCYQHWQGPGNTDPGDARRWVQQMLRELDRQVQREVSRRFSAVRTALDGVLAEAVDHGILLA